MRNRKLLATVVFSMFAFGAHASEAADLAPYKGTLPAVMQQQSVKSSLEVYKQFPALGGLTGWLVKDKSSQKYLVVYSTADGSGLLSGILMDKAGRNMTREYAEQNVPAKDYSAGYKAFSTSETAGTMIGSASAKAELTVIFDANCGYCKMLTQAVMPAINDGALRVRFVPVAILGGDSDKKAAGFLASKNPKAFMVADAAGGDLETSTDAGLLGKIRHNTDLMKKHGFNGTPVVMYKTGKGNTETLNVAAGMPDMQELYGKLGISAELAKLKSK